LEDFTNNDLKMKFNVLTAFTDLQINNLMYTQEGSAPQSVIKALTCVEADTKMESLNMKQVISPHIR